MIAGTDGVDAAMTYEPYLSAAELTEQVRVDVRAAQALMSAAG